MDCNICCEKITKSTRKVVKCNYCEFESCRICFQKYLLEIIAEPHCMNCKKEFSYTFLRENCTSVFVFNTLKKHRENVLMEREKALLPMTQQYVIKEKQKRVYEKQLAELLEKQRILTNELSLVKHEQYRLRIKYNRLLTTNAPAGENTEPDETKKFIRKCPIDDCRGFLNVKWRCGTCDTKICKNCNERKTEDHECNPESVKTMELLNKDSKPCPNCGTVIFKISGCDQMFCTECHVPFSWSRGVIVHGVVHNPHYFEFLRKGGGAVPRTIGDIPCGGLPYYRELATVLRNVALIPANIMKLENLYQAVSHIEQVEIRRTHQYNEETNRYYRVLYLLNEMSEDQLKARLQQSYKKSKKETDYVQVYNMFVDTCADMFRQIVRNNNLEFTMESLRFFENIIEYFNQTLKNYSKQYKCVAPGLNDQYRWVHNFEAYENHLRNKPVE